MPDNTPHYQHVITIADRAHINIEGVMHVDSFDDQEIVLETELGLLALRGEELHIQQLSLDDGKLVIEGIVRSVDYLEDGAGIKGLKSKGKGFLERIFK